MKLKQLGKPDRVFVVASMTPPLPDIGARQLAHSHLLQGYSKLAVHYVIRRNGDIEAGRPLHERGALAGRANETAIQVCLVGGLDDNNEPANNFTPEQHNALRFVYPTLPRVFAQGHPFKQ